MKENIKWLFFDMGGVILDDTKPETLRQEILFNVAQRYLPNITMANIYEAWLFASQQPGSVRINALHYLFKDSKLKEEAELVYNNECNVDYYGLSKVRPEAMEVLSGLSKSFNLGIMANQNVKAGNVLEDAGLLQYFSHQKMSGHIGLQKPDPNFYLEILKDSGALPSESVLIDDNWYRGLLQAKLLGLSTILYKREIIPIPDSAEPDKFISSLAELTEIFESKQKRS